MEDTSHDETTRRLELDSALPSADEADRLRDIYLDSFPEEERRDWSDIMNNEQPHLFTIRVDGEAKGLLTWWDFDDFVYIEHFAVHPDNRGQGIGEEVLEQFDEIAGDRPIILEAEPETSGEQAQRRLHFYDRNGYRILHRDYVQPPYRKGLPSVPLYLMQKHGDPLDVGKVTRTLHREVYKKSD